MKRGDIDIDFADRDIILKKLKHHGASIISDKEHKKHNTGVYFQNVPKFPLQGYSTVDHKEAEQEGWFKVDFLNNHVYNEKLSNY